MTSPTNPRFYPSKLWDALAGAMGGVIGTLLVNITFPATAFPTVVLVFVLPGLVGGAMLGVVAAPFIGRLGAAIASTLVGFVALVLATLLLVK